MIDPETKIRRSERVAFRGLEDGTGGGVLLHLDTAQYHGVNEVGAAIWDLLDAEPTFEALVDALRARVEDAPEGLDGDVQEFVSMLAERGLLELSAPGS